MEQKFYICEHCGKMIAVVRESGVPVMCCGQKMKELVPGTTDAAVEKHVPSYTVENNTVYVTVGEIEHPMANEHYIEWISLQTTSGNQGKILKPGEKPYACFAICPNEQVEAVYAYCNLHSLWKAEKETVVPVCDLKPVDTKALENYVVCKCNNVTYFDILDELGKHSDITKLLDAFEAVKDTTRCSTGCGGCYDKVLNIISDSITNGNS